MRILQALRVIAIGCACMAAALVAACAGPATRVVDEGPGIYVITKRSGFIPTRSSELRYQVEREALAYCRTQARALVVLDVQAIDPDAPAVASATLRFRCDPV